MLNAAVFLSLSFDSDCGVFVPVKALQECNPFSGVLIGHSSPSQSKEFNWHIASQPWLPW